MPVKPLVRPNAELKVSTELLEQMLDLPSSHRVAGARATEVGDPWVTLLIQADILPPLIEGDTRLHQVEPIYESVRVGHAQLKEIRTTLAEDRII